MLIEMRYDHYRIRDEKFVFISKDATQKNAQSLDNKLMIKSFRLLLKQCYSKFNNTVITICE